MFKQLIFKIRFKKAVCRANNLHDLYKKKYYILFYQNKPQILAKSDLKKMLKDKMFKKGVTLNTLTKRALYITI